MADLMSVQMWGIVFVACLFGLFVDAILFGHQMRRIRKRILDRKGKIITVKGAD